MTRGQQRIIVSIWESIDEESEDISTEQLFARTCDRASEQLGLPVDDGDVADALAKAQKEKT